MTISDDNYIAFRGTPIDYVELYIGDCLVNLSGEELTKNSIKKSLREYDKLSDFYFDFTNVEFGVKKEYLDSIDGEISLDNDELLSLLDKNNCAVVKFDEVYEQYVVELYKGEKDNESISLLKTIMGNNATYQAKIIDEQLAYSVSDNDLINVKTNKKFINHAVEKLSEMMSVVCVVNV